MISLSLVISYHNGKSLTRSLTMFTLPSFIITTVKNPFKSENSLVKSRSVIKLIRSSLLNFRLFLNIVPCTYMVKLSFVTSNHLYLIL